MFWIFVPSAIVGIAGYLLTSGLRASVIHWRVAIGSFLLLATCVAAGYLSSLSIDLSLTIFFALLPTALIALVIGFLMVGILKGWRKLTSVLVGVVFPCLMFASLSVGIDYAPEPQTLEEDYLEYTHKLVYDVQHSSASSIADFSNPHIDLCRTYLEDGLEQNAQQYSVDVISMPPFKYSFGAGSIDASTRVRFSDKREVELTFHNSTLVECKLRDHK